MVISSALSSGSRQSGWFSLALRISGRQLVGDGDVHGLLEQVLADGEQELVGRQGGRGLPTAHKVTELAHLLAEQVIVGQI